MKNHHKSFFLLLIVITASISIFAAFRSQSLLTSRTDSEFREDAQSLTSKFIEKMEEYNSLLYSGRALVTSTGDVSQTEWNQFFKNQATIDRYQGVSSIFYLEVFDKSSRAEFENRLRKEEYFGEDFSVKESTTNLSDKYAVASLVYSNNDVSSGFGFDNFSTTERVETYSKAEKLNAPTASEPIELATDFLGFFIALPVYKNDKTVDGFVAVSFRAEDLMKKVWERDGYTNINQTVDDVTDAGKPIRLFGEDSPNNSDDLISYTSEINVAQRKWRVVVSSERLYRYERLNRLLPLIIVGLGLATVAFLSTYHTSSKRKKIIRDL
jgi:CHASE1-domain containing sensor protein